MKRLGWRSCRVDDSDRPSFNALQNAGTSTASVFYYAFDVLVLAGRDLTHEPLEARRRLLEKSVLAKLNDPVRQSPVLSGPLEALVQSIREQSLEGLVAKRRDSVYEAGHARERGGRCASIKGRSS